MTSPKEEKTFLLKHKIRQIFYDNHQIYGSYRIQKVLEREGQFYVRSYIARLMKELGLRSVLRRKYVVTTHSKHAFPIAGNVLNRSFTTLNLGEKWVSDITYIRVNDDWNYLTTIIDLALVMFHLISRPPLKMRWVLQAQMPLQISAQHLQH